MGVGYLVLANAKAGGAKGEAVEAACEVLRGAGPVEVASTDDDDDVRGVLARADEGERVVVVAGGDGSLHATVNALWELGRENVPVGLVPLGTGNDFARGLGLPLDPVAAARVLVSAAPQPLDLLDYDTGVVVNVAHAGLGAAAAEQSAALKESLGPLAYPVGALIAGVRETGYDLRVTVDDAVVHDGPALLVGVGNGCCIGGGTPLCPTAAPGDGLAEVVIATGVGAAERVAFGAALRQGTHLERDDVIHVRGGRVDISGQKVGHNRDGEVGEPEAHVTYTVRHGAWRLLAPGNGTTGDNGSMSSPS